MCEANKIENPRAKMFRNLIFLTKRLLKKINGFFKIIFYRFASKCKSN